MLAMLAVIEDIENDDDRKFMAQIYLAYRRLIIWKINEMVRDENVVEDLLQETFLRLIRYIDVLKNLHGDQRKSYLVKTAESVGKNYLRKAYREEKHQKEQEVEGATQMEQNTYDPEQIFLNTELRNKLWKVLDRLSEKDRNLILYRYAYDLSYKQIAVELDIPPQNIPTYLSRAVKRLRILVEEESREHGTW